MTVVSALITKHCTSHASDSLITMLHPDGKREPLEWERSKIIPVRKLRGAMTYWGLAKYDAYQWSTFDWLTDQANALATCSTPVAFASDLTHALRKAVSQMNFLQPTNAGIGIHFSAYEYVNGYWVPELFLISNWANTELLIPASRGHRTIPRNVPYHQHLPTTARTRRRSIPPGCT